MANITASKLYDFIQCPHKVWRDVYGPQNEKIIEPNPFVELLWKKGIQHEEKIVSKIGKYLDLSEGSIGERAAKTIEALKNKVPLIYQGMLRHENLRGAPDLLELLPNGSYVPVDIKSGIALEGVDEDADDEGRPKLHYAVQLCLYNELLTKLGFANHNNGKIIDVHGDKVQYDLLAPKGVRDRSTWWDNYERIKTEVILLLEDKIRNNPASSGKCKLCPWYESCQKWCKETNDLTNLFCLGASNRDTISNDLSVSKVTDLLDLNIGEILAKKAKDKHYLRGIGEKSLTKFVERARIMEVTKKPVLYEKVIFPVVSYELFFDIEDDPTQEFVYLHGVYERHGDQERFLDFTATELGSNAEKEAWSGFWKYIDSLPQGDFAVYYYSPHEKTTYRRMQKIYTDVVSAEKVEEFFENPNVIDLYGVVRSKTDWPVGSYSLKTLATYLGFKWRDKTPSGALSIQWFNDYLENKDPAILSRILEYNEDDCRATMVIKDAIRDMGNIGCLS